MKSLGRKTLILCISAFLTFAFIGCKKEGPGEKAGKKIDKALDATKDKVNDATE
jgi:hypothetical protein